ncbi:hypothetical protein BDB01DRAFT_792444 [Pilobolus umbonatus]|nr:hypothetical protein BDB01DRAFT_792444 [Pilobolus umbonatus]
MLIRKSIKSTEPKDRWRNRFKEQCIDRIKQERQQKVNESRERHWLNLVLKEVWEQFILENEAAMKREGVCDIDEMIESDEIDIALEAFLLEEETIILNTLSSYEESLQIIVCINCQKDRLNPSLYNGVPVIACNQCGFYTTEKGYLTIIEGKNGHDINCTGYIQYSLEPGTDHSIMSVCDECDDWSIYSMF